MKFQRLWVLLVETQDPGEWSGLHFARCTDRKNRLVGCGLWLVCQSYSRMPHSISRHAVYAKAGAAEHTPALIFEMNPR